MLHTRTTDHRAWVRCFSGNWCRRSLGAERSQMAKWAPPILLGGWKRAGRVECSWPEPILNGEMSCPATFGDRSNIPHTVSIRFRASRASHCVIHATGSCFVEFSFNMIQTYFSWTRTVRFLCTVNETRFKHKLAVILNSILYRRSGNTVSLTFHTEFSYFCTTSSAFHYNMWIEGSGLESNGFGQLAEYAIIVHRVLNFI